MPSKTPAQARLMAGIAHGMKPRGGKGPSVAVAKEFNKADAGTGILSPPRQKHSGALGDAMRKSHNTKRMDAVRKHKGK